VHFLQEDSFKYHPKPPKFTPGAYCELCFQKHLAAPLEKYNTTVEASKDVLLVRKSFKGFLPIKTKGKDIVTVKNHTDKQDATMHLAFLASWNGFDVVVKFDEECEKVRYHGWEKKAWKASGHFVTMDMSRFHGEPDST
jgi:hypothetical protein